MTDRPTSPLAVRHALAPASVVPAIDVTQDDGAVPAEWRVSIEAPAAPRPDDTKALLPPRSLAELRRMVVKRDGWYASRPSLVPHRVIAELVTLAEAKQFPEADLGGAAALVTQHFLAHECARPSRFTFELIDRLSAAEDREDAERGLQRMMEAVAKLGPVATWGRTEPDLIPSAAERMQVLLRALQRARVATSLDGFVRYAEALESSPDMDPANGTTSPRSKEVEEVLAQAARHLFTIGYTAVAYQEVADRFPLEVGRGHPEEQVADHGRMLVDLTKAMIEARFGRSRTVAQCLLTIAGLELPKIANPSPTFHRVVNKIGQATRWVSPVAGEAIRAVGQMGQELDEWRQGRAIRSHIAAAMVMAPAYINGETLAAEVVAPPEWLAPNKYPEFYHLVCAERVVSGELDVRVAAFAPGLRELPRTALREAKRDATAYALAARLHEAHATVSPYTSPIAPMLPPRGTPETNEVVRLYTAVTRAFTRAAGLQLVGDGDVPLGTVQAIHAAAIAIGSLDRGVPLEHVLADLRDGMLPGVRGNTIGTGLVAHPEGGAWHAQHHLDAAGIAIVEAVIRAHLTQRAIRDVTEEPVLTPPRATATRGIGERPDAHLLPAASGASALLEGRAPHRAPLVDGWHGTLVSEYVARYAEGRVRVPRSGRGGVPRQVLLAPMEAHAAATHLAGEIGADAFRGPVTLLWVPVDTIGAQPGDPIGDFTLGRWASDHAATGVYNPGPDAPEGEAGHWCVRWGVAEDGTPLCALAGALPPAMRDALAAIHVVTPPGHQQPTRARRELPVRFDAARPRIGASARVQLLAEAAKQTLQPPAMKRQIPGKSLPSPRRPRRA